MMSRHGVGLLFVLLMLALVPAETAAQNGGGEGGVVCWWCEEGILATFECADPNDPNCEELVLVGWEDAHAFYEGGEGCSGGANGGGSGTQCSRCGGTSMCHEFPMEGPCHLECGPGGGELAMAIQDLEETIMLADAEEVVRVIRSSPAIKLSPDRASVIALPSCGTDDEPIRFLLPTDLAVGVAALLSY
jgi:hypothetical protein